MGKHEEHLLDCLKHVTRIVLVQSWWMLLWVGHGYAQCEQDSLGALKNDMPAVYIDCSRCDSDFIRTEITFVHYVRDRQEADVHILVTTQPTGSGGTEYTLTLFGQRSYAGMNDTLRFTVRQSDTDDAIRNEMMRVLKMGLVRYVLKTPAADHVSVTYAEPGEPPSVMDAWDNWVFRLDLSGSSSGEKTRSDIALYAFLSADRVTPGVKTRLSINADYARSDFTIAGRKISSFARGKGARGLLVKSLGAHWSAGIWGSALSSTYANTKLAIDVAPAIEYDLFPYDASTRRQLRFLHKAGYVLPRYTEETIYGKLSETLAYEAVSLTLEVKKVWGSVRVVWDGSHYFRDLSKNRSELFADLSLNILSGVSLRVSGKLSRIHDQLSLPRRGATPEEILLQRTQLATQYNYYGGLGVSYTFGSIHNNVVNPRFGN